MISPHLPSAGYCLLNYSHSDGMVIVWFVMARVSFHVLIAHLSIFGETAIEIFCPFFSRVICPFSIVKFVSILCIFQY